MVKISRWSVSVEGSIYTIQRLYREKINQIKPKKAKSKWAKSLWRKERNLMKKEKVNTHVPSGLHVYNKFAYGDVLNQLEIYMGKRFGKKLVVYI